MLFSEHYFVSRLNSYVCSLCMKSNLLSTVCLLHFTCVCSLDNTIHAKTPGKHEQRKEEEPYSCAGSCGCPVPFNWRESSLQSTLLWVKKNRVEWLAGITTGLTAVPTAVAFAILAGVKPSVGLRGTWIIMLVMALFGGELCS